jgi:hypothetical protein
MFFCLVETFLKIDNKPRDLHTKYRWTGKCRKLSNDKGGIGICINDKVTVLDVNLVGSKEDGFERLWVLTRINGVKTAVVGVAYFPNDGIHNPLTDKLFYELLEKLYVFPFERVCNLLHWRL